MRGLFDRLSFRRPSSTAVRVLLIDDYAPDRSIGAGIPRTAELLRAMSAVGADVTVWPVYGKAGRPVDMHGASLAPGLGPFVRFAIAVLRGRAGVDLMRLKRLRRFLKHRAASFDGIIVSRPHNMRTFLALVKQPPKIERLPPVVYDAEALYAERDIAMHDVLGHPFAPDQAQRMLDDELGLAAGAQIVLTVNQSAADAFTRAGSSDVRILAYSATPHPTLPTYEQRGGFLFVGPTRLEKEPNSDAVVWFADNVLPLLRERFRRDVVLTVVGMTGAQNVLMRAAAGLEIKGVLPDLSEVYSRARVFVAPTRFAAGIPLKVYDAAAHGVPTVITPILARAIGWTHERETLVAASPADFAIACHRLHEDRELWERIRSTALERVREDCSTAHFDRVVAALLGSLAELARSSVAP
jgi:glycosyltransferase involved in cell wall biosynthesis